MTKKEFNTKCDAVLGSSRSLEKSKGQTILEMIVEFLKQSYPLPSNKIGWLMWGVKNLGGLIKLFGNIKSVVK